MESGISIYFSQNKIRLRYKTIEDLDYPEYIHLKINEAKKHLFIEKCERDIDSFHIEYKKQLDGKKVKDQSCYINAKKYLEYMAAVIGVPMESPSLRFFGKAVRAGIVFIDLNHYQVIEYKRVKSVSPT